MSKIKKLEVTGRLVLKEINFKDVYYGPVSKSNATSSKIYLPKKLEGKYVYVIAEGE